MGPSRVALVLVALTVCAGADGGGGRAALERARALHARAAAAARQGADPPCPDHPPPVALPDPLPPALAAALAAISASFTATLNGTTNPGGAFELAYRGAPLLSVAAGVAVKEPHRAVDGATLFRVASVSKVFPALLLGVLAAAGAVPSLDAPVAAIAPAFAPRNPFDAGVPTLRHLAAHLSGLQREAPAGVNTTAGALAAVSRTLLIAPPGAAPSYSNLGFAVLAHVLAAAAGAGDDVPRAVRDAITGPCALADTGYDYGAPGIADRLAAGYDAAGAAVPFADLGWWFPAGSMYSTPRDLAALGAALLSAAGGGDGGGLRLGPARARDLLRPVYWNRDGRTGFGTPWEIRQSSNYTVLVKGGNLPGYTAVLALVPDANVTFAAAWNGATVDEFAFADAVAGALLPPLAAALAALRPVPPYDPGPAPAAYVGAYSFEGTRVVVSLSGGALLWFCEPLGFTVALDFVAAGDADLGDVFRADFPDAAYPCQLGELEALRGQYVLFGRGAGGAVNSTAMPGWIPGAAWTR